MKNPVNKLYDTILPDPQTLWDRGDANMEEVEIDQGRYMNVPFFDIEIEDVKRLKPGRIIDHLERDIGEFHGFRVRTSDGIDRAARVYKLDDLHRSPSDMYLHADTAWTTPITGHNDYAISRLASQTGLDAVIVGAEHGTNKYPYPLELLRVGHTALRSTGISLAKSAQSSQLITTHLRDEYQGELGLSNNMLMTGESRGSMLAPAHYPYAKYYGNTILYSDTTAPCVPEKMFSEKADSLRLAAWLGYEAVGGLMLGMEIMGQQAFKRRLGTVALNPNFVVSNLIGVGPALFSGEFGKFADWVPRDAAMFYSTFKNDLFAKPDVLRRLYKDHENVYIRTHKSGTHATLANDKVIDAKSMRFNAFQALYGAKGSAISPQELRAIYDMRVGHSRLELAA
ncbi:MAG: hypothetical protein JWM00_462 [Candidatus Saccharibacteria bacterium]|nr:hypothetical protein [Candidatus Saccharibacteria bacterium]